VQKEKRIEKRKKMEKGAARPPASPRNAILPSTISEKLVTPE